jgi:hypothetical protein
MGCQLVAHFLNITVMGNQEKKEASEVDILLYALQQRNLVYNYDFRYFSNQVANGSVIEYNTPDGWQHKDTGTNGTIGFDEVNKTCVIKKSGGNEEMTFTQALHEFPRWKQMLLGKTITGKVIMNIGIQGNVTVSLTDGVNTTAVTKSTKGELELELQLDIDESATELILSIETAVPFMTLNIATCNVNIGLVSILNLPCVVQGVIGERKQYIATENAPAEELSLCNGLTELTGEYTRLRSVINNKFGVNSKTNAPYLINMGGYFSRAWDNGSGIDPDAKGRLPLQNGTIKGDKVSTLEEDIFLKHNHGLNFSINKNILTGDKGAATVIDPTSTSNTKDESDGKETRPINIAELYTIKWA